MRLSSPLPSVIYHIALKFHGILISLKLERQQPSTK